MSLRPSASPPHSRRRSPGLRGAVTALALAALLGPLAACGSEGSGTANAGDPASETVRATTVAAPNPGPGPVNVVAVGDIACPPGRSTSATQCQQAATARLAQSLNPDLVLTLGDHQYETSTLDRFQNSYDKSWGALLDRTFPVPGNHEYYDPGAAGYYAYFAGRQPGPPGYYQTRAGAWKILMLNTVCDQVDCNAQAAWLKRQLRRNRTKCTLITTHHPRWSSGQEHGNNPSMGRFWRIAYRHRADVMLSGHEHNYERFAALSPRGTRQPRRGLSQYVVGTGGKNLYPAGVRRRHSQVFDQNTFGVLQMRLAKRSWSWTMHGIDGRVMDSGNRRCR